MSLKKSQAIHYCLTFFVRLKFFVFFFKNPDSPKRGRGRPPKQAGKAAAPAKKRGRPAKAASDDDEASTLLLLL